MTQRAGHVKLGGACCSEEKRQASQVWRVTEVPFGGQATGQLGEGERHSTKEQGMSLAQDEALYLQLSI